MKKNLSFSAYFIPSEFYLLIHHIIAHMPYSQMNSTLELKCDNVKSSRVYSHHIDRLHGNKLQLTISTGLSR